jgi:hypothetical protein
MRLCVSSAGADLGRLVMFGKFLESMEARPGNDQVMVESATIGSHYGRM